MADLNKTRARGWIYRSLRAIGIRGVASVGPPSHFHSFIPQHLIFIVIIIISFHHMFFFWGCIFTKWINKQIHFSFTLATRGRLYHLVCTLKFKISQESAGIGPDWGSGWGYGRTWPLPWGACGWRIVGVGPRRTPIVRKSLKMHI